MSNDNPFSTPNPFPMGGVPPAGYQPTYVPAPRTSVMALFSLLSAIASPLLICLCVPSMVTSLISIVLGHIALYRISKSPGTLGGRWLALRFISLLLWGAWHRLRRLSRATLLARLLRRL